MVAEPKLTLEEYERNVRVAEARSMSPDYWGDCTYGAFYVTLKELPNIASFFTSMVKAGDIYYKYNHRTISRLEITKQYVTIPSEPYGALTSDVLGKVYVTQIEGGKVEHAGYMCRYWIRAKPEVYKAVIDKAGKDWWHKRIPVFKARVRAVFRHVYFKKKYLTIRKKDIV